MIIINAQLTLENLCNYLCKNAKGNVIEFPIKKSKNNTLKSNFTSQGKPKTQPADSVKTLEEIEKIKKYFLNRKEYRNYCLFIIGITTGYRIGDLLQLKFCDFFNQDYSYKDELDVFEQKTKKRRKMPITENIKNALDLYTRHDKGFYLDRYVFKSQKGKNSPLDSSSVRKIFNDMTIDLKLPYHCSTHFLRKTFAYWFLQIHKNDITALATFQDILNHSSEKMTFKYCGIEKEKSKCLKAWRVCGKIYLLIYII